MAKITMTIEDLPDGTFAFQSNPPVKHLQAKAKIEGPRSLTVAESHVICFAARILRDSQVEEHKSNLIHLPSTQQ